MKGIDPTMNPSLMQTIPKTLREYQDVAVWGMIHHIVHSRKGMFTIVITGKRGSGKSWTSMELARLLDRGRDDVPRFSVERICYTPLQFKEWISKTDLPIGTVITLDDAGLALYSKEALKKVVVELGKTLQQVRRKYPILIMCIPYFTMLESHSRRFADLYMEVQPNRDMETKQNLVRIQVLKGDYYSGELYRYNLNKYHVVTHPKFKMDFRTEGDNVYRVDKPPQSLAREYEKERDKKLTVWDKESFDKLKKLESKTDTQLHKWGFKESIEYTKKKWKDFVDDKGRISPAKILLETNEKGESRWSRGVANMIARELNDLREVGELT